MRRLSPKRLVALLTLPLVLAGTFAVAHEVTAPKAAQASECNIGATISYGSRGPWVSYAQQQLRSKGYNIGADGIFGSQTKNAVVSFQRSRGLQADGIVGVNTWHALTC